MPIKSALSFCMQPIWQAIPGVLPAERTTISSVRLIESRMTFAFS